MEQGEVERDERARGAAGGDAGVDFCGGLGGGRGWGGGSVWDAHFESGGCGDVAVCGLLVSCGGLRGEVEEGLGLLLEVEVKEEEGSMEATWGGQGLYR